MRSVATFVAQQIPRYDAADFEQRAYENLLGQRALWSGLAFLAMRDSRCGVEVSLASDHNQSIELSISLVAEERELPRTDEMVRQIERLVPFEYRWHRRVAPLVGDEDQLKARWKVARVVRRTEFLDLPYHSLALARTSGDAPSGGTIFRRGQVTHSDPSETKHGLSSERTRTAPGPK